MQTVYRVNLTSYRSSDSSEILTTSKEAFDMMVDASKSDIEIYNIPAPGAKVDEHGELVDEDENLVEWMFMHQDFSLSMPYILADEITFYVE